MNYLISHRKIQFLHAFPRFPLILALTLFTARANPIEIDPEQSVSLNTLEADGRTLPSIDFSGQRRSHLIVPLPHEQMEWMDKSSLDLRLFSPSASEAEMIVVLRNSTDTKEADAFPGLYHWIKLRVDWEGWRNVSLPLADFIPSTTSIEIGQRDLPPEISQIIFCNQIGPDDPIENTWGIPQPSELSLGVEKISVR
jgi:hypothetical protein